MDLTKTITLYDRGYNSVELMFKTDIIKFILHNTWKNIQHLKRNNKKWKNIKKQIKHFFISLDSLKRRNFKNEELKEMARLKANIKVRIVKVKLKNGKT
ncbi:hypothetical protein MBORA_09690 [Methanobrevibacter oralis]|uniref:Transposase IS4-like domain-containing protein n=1 Tax=Methanobrevibacter oralis TaxID=66851 RepID=A0A166BA29_METOA|nr:hypothetical protein [Methanobrevibacter oralis]KZX13066.1 hypothetical protein MBORA_09690 [Methanobrevibacter oralis]